MPVAVRVTRHAIERFSQRFPGHDPVESIERSRFVSTTKVMRAALARGRAMVGGNNLERRYYADRETSALWIAVPDSANPSRYCLVTVVRQKV